MCAGAQTLCKAKLTDLSPLHLWAGLKNGDDQGTKFDLQVEVFKGGSLVSSGLQRCVAGVVRNPSAATEAIVVFNPFPPVPVSSGDVLALRVSTRIGTTATGAKCTASGGSHGSAQGLRIYYDAASRPARLDVTITPDSSKDVFLHSDGSPCPAGGGESPGVTKRFLNTTVPPGGSAKCKDSGAINFAFGNAFSVIGTWGLTLP